jgi:hypothetical protein
MKPYSVVVMVCVAAGAAQAAPTVTNQDEKPYSLEMDCKHISSGLKVYPNDTVELESFKVGMSCQLNVYPGENPYGADGNYDPKKKLSSSKLKKDSECVVNKGRVVCE